MLIDTGVNVLSKHIEGLIATFPKISSISIGVPGSVDNGRIFYIPGYEKFQNFNLKSHLEEQFSIPVVIENDMNAAVLGYYKTMETMIIPLLYICIQVKMDQVRGLW